MSSVTAALAVACWTLEVGSQTSPFWRISGNRSPLCIITCCVVELEGAAALSGLSDTNEALVTPV